MLVVKGVDVGSHGSAIGVRFTVLQGGNQQNATQTNLKFDATILVEVVIPDIF